MRNAIVQVRGGVAEVTHEPHDVLVLVVDWDHLKEAVGMRDDGDELLGQLEKALEPHQVDLAELNRLMHEIERE